MIASKLPPSIADNPLLSDWVAFIAPGCVRVGSGKVEIGQGIVTALTQIAAEELDLALDQVELASGQTDVSPFEGYTSGSYSVSVGGSSIRVVCAEVRALMLQQAAARLGCDVAELSVERGAIHRGGQNTGLTYWSLAGDVDMNRAVTGEAKPKRPADYTIVGTSVPRLDLPAKLRGEGFIHDMQPDNVLHARVLRQPWRDAQLQALDEERVRKAARAPIEIVRKGNFVAFVSESEIATFRASDVARTTATWGGGDPVPDHIGGINWLKQQPSKSTTVDTGTPVPATQGRTVESLYTRPFLTYGSIGPSCGLALYEDGKLKVWSHCQGPEPLRDWIATSLKLDKSQVEVFHRQGAGAYGHNTADDAAFEASVLALEHPGRTIRVLLTREDEFAAAPVSPAMAVGLRATLGDDNKPVDWQIEIWSPPHAARPGMNGNANFAALAAMPDAPPMKPLNDVPYDKGGGATRNSLPLYDLPHHRMIHHMIPGTPLRTSSLRGLGAWANVFAIESFIEELAEIAGVDPVAYRLSLLSDERARRTIETVAEMSGWADKADMKGEGRALGLGFARYKNIAAYGAVVVEVEVEEDVRLKHVWCASDAGLVINPDGAINQLEGGIIQGSSFVLREQVRYEGGRATPSNWDDYPILRFSDIPEIEIRLIDNPDQPALGLGECSVGPAGAAIGNAVARALGKRVRDLPMTRERIMDTLLND